MPNVSQVGIVTVSLYGWTGAPGTNTWTVSKGDGATWPEAFDSYMTTLDSLYSAVNEYLVGGVTWVVDREATVYDAGTGLVDEDYSRLGAALTGIGTGTAVQLNRACSVRIRGYADGRIDNKRPTNGCYIGPLASEAIDDEGQLESGVGLAIQGAWLVSGPGPAAASAAWRRPVVEFDDDGNRTVKRPGQAFTASNPVTQNSKVAMLTSRRD